MKKLWMLFFTSVVGLLPQSSITSSRSIRPTAYGSARQQKFHIFSNSITQNKPFKANFDPQPTQRNDIKYSESNYYPSLLSEFERSLLPVSKENEIKTFNQNKVYKTATTAEGNEHNSTSNSASRWAKMYASQADNTSVESLAQKTNDYKTYDAKKSTHRNSRRYKRSLDETLKAYVQEIGDNFDDESKENDHLTISRRGRLDRMPVHFGKRLENHDFYYQLQMNPFQRNLTDRVNRMPIAYGKRDTSSQTGNSLLQEFDTRRLQSAEDNADSSDYGGYFVRSLNEKFGRHPKTFGDGEDVTLLEDNDYKNSYMGRETRGRPGRMPVTFGKRVENVHHPKSFHFKEFATNSEHAGSPNNQHDRRGGYFRFDDEVLTRDLRSKLGRMPLAFGKRANDCSTKNIIGCLDLDKREAALRRMPMGFGKRYLSVVNSQEPSSLEQIEEAVARNELDRQKISNSLELEHSNIPSSY